DAVLPLRLLVLEGEPLVEAAGGIEDVPTDGEHRAGQAPGPSSPRAQRRCAAGKGREPPVVERPEAPGLELREVSKETRGEAGRKPQPAFQVPDRQRRRGAGCRLADRRG